MDIAAFSLLGLEPVESGRHRFRMEVTPSISTPFHFLYGGAGIAASAEASERASGRPLQWITTQFLGSPAPGDMVELDVDVAVEARMTTQTQVSGRVDGELMFVSLAAHNLRPVGDIAPVAPMPAVEAPDECPPFAELFPNSEQSFFSKMERRLAAGTIRFPDGRGVDAAPFGDRDPETVAMWCRLTDDVIGSAATQAFVADIGPLGVCAKLGLPLGGTSLDNTLRLVETRPTEWVLLELEVDGYSRSTGHSTTRLWAQDGRLLGVAQQSALIRNSHHDRRVAES